MATESTAGHGDLLADARKWMRTDPDPQTRAELELLLQRADAGDTAAHADLQQRFGGRLGFGTAGLRGELGAGPTRMNRVVVRQTAAAIARFLLDRASASAPLVVIGYDARVNSDVFASESAAVFAAAGVRVQLMPRALPTPVLAFAVRHLGAAGGVMVTASHNPPRDNGYKVYLGGDDQGSQLVSPADTEIAAIIDEVAAAGVPGLDPDAEWEPVDDSVIAAYIAATAAVAHQGGDPDAAIALGARFTWAYTPMHGVGGDTFMKVLHAAGLPEPVRVGAQYLPDGAFPTVSFPNPEEPGALDLAYQTAREIGAELVVAHDPDADRLAIAVPDPAAESGWERLGGNEVGALLGWWVAQRVAADRPVDRLTHPDAPTPTLAASVVSSPLLGEIAEYYRLGFRETLTGFKWISRTPGIVFGYEEALGYLVNPEDVRDKDGISASVAFLALLQQLRSTGSNLTEHRRALDETFGVHRSGQVPIRFAHAADAAPVMQALTADPPADWAGVAVDRLVDFSAGVGGLPPTELLRFALADGSRIQVRPSGTEPKLKIYLDVRGPADGTLEQRRAAAAARLDALTRAVRTRFERPLG